MTDTQSKLQTTPIKAKLDAINRWGLDLPELKELRRQFAEGMQAYWIGLPSVKDFMAWLMDNPTTPLRSLKSVRFAYTPGTKEDQMYEPLVSVVLAVVYCDG